jgi:hypothetical protein
MKYRNRSTSDKVFDRSQLFLGLISTVGGCRYPDERFPTKHYYHQSSYVIFYRLRHPRRLSSNIAGLIIFLTLQKIPYR